MGYDIRFEGRLTITPQLSGDQVRELSAYVDRAHAGSVGSQRCCWRPLESGAALAWDGCEKFTGYAAALAHVVSTFLAPWGHELGGVVHWEGEDGATGRLRVEGATIVDEPDDEEPPLDERVRSWTECLRGQDDAMRVVAARELGCAIDGEARLRGAAIAALLEALAPAQVAKAALHTLGDLGEDAGIGVAAVTRCLEHTDPQVRYWATYALGRMGPRAIAALPALERLRTDPEYGPRYGAIDAIARLRSLGAVT